MVPGSAIDENVTSYRVSSKSYGWLYQSPQNFWAFLNIVAAKAGAKEDVYAEKLS